MVHSILDLKALILLSMLACGCGGSSQGSGPADDSGAGSAGTSPGTSNGASACSAINPCGGDLLGDWTIKDLCMGTSTQPFGGSCAGVTLSLGLLAATGSISFRADNTEVGTATLSYRSTVHIPADCYDEGSCNAYQTALNAVNDVSNAMCSWDAGSGCACTTSVTTSSMANGTYQVQGTNVSFTDFTTGRQSVASFCVSGNTLRLYSVDATNGLTSSMTLTR